MSTITGRLALALGILLLLAAALVTFVPASPSGATCGNWLAPEWGDDETQEIIDRASDTYDQATALGSDSLANESASIVVGARRAHDLCADALATRRTIALVLVGLGLVVPVAVLFVGGSRRRPGPPAAA